jgi:hypothetical protein
MYKLETHFLPSNCYGGYIDGSKNGACIHHAYSTSLQGCYNALKSRSLSTFAAIDGKTVWQLMPDWHSAEWATGNTEGNNSYISVELINTSLEPPYTVSDSTIQTFEEYIADLTKQGIITPKNGKYTWNELGGLMPHRSFSATACPGDYLMSKGDEIASMINNLLRPLSWSVQMYQVNNTVAQDWHIQLSDHKGWYKIRSGANDMLLNVKGAATTSGSPVWAYFDDDSDACLWRFESPDNANIYNPQAPCLIVPKINPKKCLTAKGSSLVLGDKDLAEENANKRWGSVDKGNGFSVFVCVDTMQALDLVGGGM